MFKPGHLALVPLMFYLAGCATATNHQTAPNWAGGEPGESQPLLPPPDNNNGAIPMLPSGHMAQGHPVAQPQLRAAPDLTATNITEEWITLDRWCEVNHLGPPTRYVAATVSTYMINTPHGALTLKAGSRVALWDGRMFQIGFAPREADGRLLVEVLDARKNFQPLVDPFSLPAFGMRSIVIDPGHGGSNTGTKSAHSGRLEKEFTLDWALRLGDLLSTNGWKVLYTRTADVDVSLSNRVEFAEEQHADLFLSLHFNSSPDRNPTQAGLESYCLTPRGMTSNLTRDYEDDALKTFPNNMFDEQNLQYAIRFHRALLSANGNKDRGVRRARFMGVLLGQHRPAVLLEGGFLSNPGEAQEIESPAYRQKLAEAVARALQ